MLPIRELCSDCIADVTFKLALKSCGKVYLACRELRDSVLKAVKVFVYKLYPISEFLKKPAVTVSLITADDISGTVYRIIYLYTLDQLAVFDRA